jgi:hypothetical protein
MDIKEHMEAIGADGVHIGTVDKIEGDRLKLTKKDSGEGSHKGHHHFIDKGLVTGVEGNKVRLSANAALSAGTSRVTKNSAWTVPPDTSGSGPTRRARGSKRSGGR